jgi:hypothetical protein
MFTFEYKKKCARLYACVDNSFVAIKVRPKKERTITFRAEESVIAEIERVLPASNLSLAEALREACAAINRYRKRCGIVPRYMEIQGTATPTIEELDWSVAEAPPGETINSVMAQTHREAAANLAGRIRREILVHPHFVHKRGRLIFPEYLRDAVLEEISELQSEVQREKKSAPTKGRIPGAAPSLSDTAPRTEHGGAATSA